MRLAPAFVFIAWGILAEGSRADDYPTAGSSLALRSTLISEESFEPSGAGASVGGKEYQLTAWTGLPDAGPVALGLGLDYQYTRYEFSGIEGRNRDLHSLQLPVGMSYTTGDWRLEGLLAPGVATSSNIMKDLPDEATRDDLIVTARLETSHGPDGPFRWLAGLAWDRSFGEPRLYPIAGLLYAPSDFLRARLAFPESAIQFRYSGRQEVLLRIAPAGNEWHVFSEELQADFDYVVEAWRGELIWSVRVWRLLFLDIGAGYETGRHAEFVDDRGMAVDADINDAYVLYLGVRLGETPLPRSHSVTPP